MIGAAPRTQTSWDWRAAGNFIGGGAGTGLLIVGGFSAFFSGTPIVTFVPLALALVVAGLGLVWLEIGRPWRFIHVVFNVGTSWMTREALLAPPLLTLGGQAIFFGDPVYCLAPGMFGLAFLYCQSRMLSAAKGIPAWREPMVVPLMILTGLTEGAGLLLTIVVLSSGSVQWPLAVFLTLVGFRLVAWLGYRRRLAASGAPIAALNSLAGIGRWFVPLGFVLPVMGATAALVFGPPALPAAALAGISAVAGGWLLKYRLVTEAASTQGFALPLSPVRGQGSAGPGTRPGWN